MGQAAELIAALIAAELTALLVETHPHPSENEGLQLGQAPEAMFTRPQRETAYSLIAKQILA